MEPGIGLVWYGLVWSSMVSLLVKSILRNGFCRVIKVPFWKLWRLLRCLEAFGRSVTTACCESKTYHQPPLFNPSCHIYFPDLLSSHHKSSQLCLHYFRWHGGMEPAGGTRGELGGPLQQSNLWSCTTLS
jgi:hypothetical protein